MIKYYQGISIFLPKFPQKHSSLFVLSVLLRYFTKHKNKLFLLSSLYLYAVFPL
jgi:hypothetical protein